MSAEVKEEKKPLEFTVTCYDRCGNCKNFQAISIDSEDAVMGICRTYGVSVKDGTYLTRADGPHLIATTFRDSEKKPLAVPGLRGTHLKMKCPSFKGANSK